MKHNSPQLGFNNNVRHRGRVFHIQTEDSGVKHPHIITHLFADGGRILKSTKTSYAEFLGEEELSKKVRSLMQEQHKAMFIALRAGKFDHMIGEAPEGSEGAPASQVGAESTASIETPPSLNGGALSAPAPRAPMPSLTGATEFARADVPAPPTASQIAPAVAASPPDPQRSASQPSTPSPASAAPSSVIQPGRPKSNAAMAHAETMATMNAVAEHIGDATSAAAQTAPPRSASPRSGSVPPPGALAQEPPRARLTPPPPRNAEPMLSPLRALGARPSPPHAYPAPGSSANQAARPASGPQNKPPSRAPSVPPTARPPLSASLDLDLEALERAAEQSQVPVYQQIRDLPPPPTSLLKPSAPRNTSYRSVTPQATQIVDPKAPGAQPAPPPPPAAPPRGAPTIPRAPASNRGSSSRYAPSRPASIFGSSRPQEGSSIFGEDLISEKSLDEVILSYLAEDLEGGPPKK